ncbi:MAG: EI24 domain-containing protein [Leptospiraceae bacterium]|nr:EI24 domain-containing protein [Leptospiraceae bacterium]MCP5497690.1 EI24 domain-containing protein [Leptospiraceae bacterium]
MINYFTRFYYGFRAFFSGFKIINQNRLWKYTIVPCFISLVLGGVLLYGIFQVSSAFLQIWILKILQYFNYFLSQNNLPPFLLVIIYIVTFVFSVVCYILIYRPIASIVVIPFMGHLLSQLEKIYYGKEIEISLKRDIINGILGAAFALRDMIIGLIAMILGLFLGPFQIFFIAFAEGYLLGRGSFDYIFEKTTENLQERKQKIRNFQPEILGLGVAQFLFLFIPVVGVVVAPVLSLAGAVRVYSSSLNDFGL